MRGFLFQVPLLVAAAASAHLIGITSLIDQKGLQDGSTIQGHCYWDGTSPFCAGGCPQGYIDCRTDTWGDGARCWTGYKKYCCQGACQNSLPLKVDHDVEALGEQHHHKGNGPLDDWCDEGQTILCPPGAKHNEECTCVDDPSVKRNH